MNEKLYCDRINETVDIERCNACDEANEPCGCDSEIRKRLLGVDTTERLIMRDLKKDLELCNNTYPGPWYKDKLSIIDDERHTICDTITLPDVMKFILEARQGWPEAIKRALKAEEENAILRQQIDKERCESSNACLDWSVKVEKLEAENAKLRNQLTKKDYKK